MQTEIDLLEIMSTKMEIDDDAAVTTLSKASCVELALRTSPFVKKGKKLCIICFSGAMKKNANREIFKK